MRSPLLAIVCWFTALGAASATEIHLRLGDLVAGGNGCGLAPVTQGINPRNGTLAKVNTFSGNGGTGPKFSAADGTGGKVNYPLIDGVFVAHNTTQIDTLGGTFAFPATANGTTWDAIRNAVALVDSGNTQIPMRLDDQPGVDRIGIGLHTNCGVTFDLAAIRAANGASTLRVEGVAGLNWEACAGADVEIWVLVDGVARFHQAFLLGGNAQAFSIPLTDNDRFLSIASTDQDVSDGCDHGVMADPILVIDAPLSDCNGNHVEDSCELSIGVGADCDANGIPDDCQWQFTDVGVGCGGAGGLIPVMQLSGCGAPGSTLTLYLSNAVGGSIGLLFFGLNPASIPIPGTPCHLAMTPIAPNPLALPIGGAGAGNGNVTAFGSLPAGAPLSGAFVMQAFVPDAVAPHGFSTTAGLRVWFQ